MLSFNIALTDDTLCNMPRGLECFNLKKIKPLVSKGSKLLLPLTKLLNIPKFSGLTHMEGQCPKNPCEV